MITATDRLIAAAWWIVAITVGPIAVVGFFVGGWLILAALAAWWMNMDVRNPFAHDASASEDERHTEPLRMPDPDLPNRERRA